MTTVIVRLFLIIDLLGSESRGKEQSLSADHEQIIQDYQAEAQDDGARVKRFQKDFTDALKKIENLQWVGDLYTYGLMCHLGYVGLAPSFMAYVDLYQGLYRYIEEIESDGMTIPPAVRQAFRCASNQFIDQVHALKSITDIETYSRQLNKLFKDFLVGFIKDNQDFFQAHWKYSLEKASKDQAKKLSIIDRAFFALKEGWPGHDSNDSTYQFEALYVYRCQDNRRLMLGYNDRPIACDRFLHIYVWDPQEPERGPVQLKYLDKAGFDLSPSPRPGGCSECVTLLDKVQFDGHQLKFSGYEFEAYKSYVFDVMTGEIKLKN